MCGIIGIVAKDPKQYESHAKKMLDAIAYRGPDERGIRLFERCILGHTRLSIVDLRSGQQPMVSPASPALGITFNGEIYGYDSIKNNLPNYPFRTTSDTEVILALYEKFGQELPRHLPGMFSFAIWDGNHQQLVCARDRFGEKPFFYAIGEKGEFIFASEIKAILASGLVKPILNKHSVVHYLKHLYIHPNTTIYTNIHTLPPGHTLGYNNNGLCIKRYWQPPEINPLIGLDDAIVQFKFLLEKAIERQLIADVPVGALLSGGVDSTTIVALASKHVKKIKTFSFGFGSEKNELPFAREVARKYNTEHIELEDHHADIGEMLLAMRDIYDEPFADSSNIPTYLITKLASKYVKVALSGDGGDELFGGYAYWLKPLLVMENERESASIWKLLLFKTIAKLMRNGYWNNHYRGIAYATRFSSIAEAHRAQNTYFNAKELSSLNPSFINVEQDNYSYPHLITNTVNDALYMDLQDYLPGDILVKTDRASMANGLELRTPFLDIDFSSFCISLPRSLKITEEEDKIILRKTCADLWPESIRQRQKKGFGAPVNKWLAQESVQQLKKHYLENPHQEIFGFISFKHSRPFVRENTYRTWVLLVLALWFEKHKPSII